MKITDKMMVSVVRKKLYSEIDEILSDVNCDSLLSDILSECRDSLSTCSSVDQLYSTMQFFSEKWKKVSPSSDLNDISDDDDDDL